MKCLWMTAFIFGGTLAACADELPLKRVVLSTSGLAQFTHGGEVTAGSTIDLSVRLDQVDDLLKSLTIYDRSGGIGAVSLPGKSPLSELFRDLPFGPEALNSPSAMLNALVGAEIEIEGQVNAKGRVFRVENETTTLPNNGGVITKHRLTLLTERGMVQAILEELSALRFTDETAKAQIDRALAGIAQNRAKERRSLSISVLGEGKRQAGFSYVVAAPVWKTAYRLVLPREGGKARLQGWGVIENLTGGDWNNVELSLVSGNPVALKQALYAAFFVERPEIPVTSAQRIVPKKDESGESWKPGAFPAPSAKARGQLSVEPERAGRITLGQSGQQGGEFNFFEGSADLAAAPEEIGGAALAAQAEDALTQIIYRFPHQVTLAAGSTMMLPFFDGDISASRTWLYQPETNARRPFAAVRVRNDGASALPSGIITAFDTNTDGATNFAGDAQLPLTPKGASKFVTFALDGKTEIRRFDKGVRQTRLGKAVNGELTIMVKSRRDIEYEITPPAEEDRDIVIDEARADGWKPVGDTKGVEETAARIRYPVLAPKGVMTKASLSFERIGEEKVILKSVPVESLLVIIGNLQNEGAALKDTLAKLGALVGDITKANATRAELEAETKRIAEDQERIRRNLTAVGQGSDLGRRYLDTLRGQEDRLAAIATADKALQAELAEKRKTAADLAQALTL